MIASARFDRRRLILGGGFSVVSATLSRAQPARTRQIGFIGGGQATQSEPFLSVFVESLPAYGWAVGSTVRIVERYAQGRLDDIPGFVADLERQGVDVIVTHAQATAPVVRAARTLPAVYQFSADPVASGFAPDLAHPQFNATGITLLAAELNAKRLDLLVELMPDIRRVAVVYNPLHPGEHLERGWLESRGQALSLQLSYFPASARAQLGPVLEAAEASRPEALLVLSDGFTVENRQAILGVTRRLRIPAVAGWAVMADAGAVLTFGPRLAESYRRAGYFTDRILRGARPADLPIERPSVVELVINERAVGELGRTVPPALLARADRVID
jgi:putative tryptophan/tyrosine transport system substrate-binding protein